MSIDLDLGQRFSLWPQTVVGWVECERNPTHFAGKNFKTLRKYPNMWYELKLSLKI